MKNVKLIKTLNIIDCTWKLRVQYKKFTQACKIKLSSAFINFWKNWNFISKYYSQILVNSKKHRWFKFPKKNCTNIDFNLFQRRIFKSDPKISKYPDDKSHINQFGAVVGPILVVENTFRALIRYFFNLNMIMNRKSIAASRKKQMLERLIHGFTFTNP